MCITSQQHPRYSLVQQPLGDSSSRPTARPGRAAQSPGCQAREGFGDKRAAAGQSEESLRTPATFPSLPDPNRLLPHKRRRGLVKISPLLPQPRAKRSQLLLLRGPLPQILGLAQAGGQGRASSSFTLLGGDAPFLAPTGSRAVKLSYPWPREAPTGPPALEGATALGRDLEAMGMTTLLKRLDPNPWQVPLVGPFPSGNKGLWGESLEDPALPRLLPPTLGKKEGKGPKALWAIISQQLLVSKISVGGRVRAL